MRSSFAFASRSSPRLITPVFTARDRIDGQTRGLSQTHPKAGLPEALAQIRYLDQTSQLIELALRNLAARECLDRHRHEPGMDSHLAVGIDRLRNTKGSPESLGESRAVLRGQG